MLERGPQTLKETSFNQAYGRELSDANEWCNNYKVKVEKTQQNNFHLNLIDNSHLLSGY
jgi:hypothetical protein